MGSFLVSQSGAHFSGLLQALCETFCAGVTTLQGIADALNARGIRTARGRRWYATTVKNVLDRVGVEGVKEAA